jgi:hypothetical protein
VFVTKKIIIGFHFATKGNSMKTGWMTSFLLTLTAPFLALTADEQKQPNAIHDRSGYVDLGLGPLPALLPVFGVGYREQWGHHGLDNHLQVATVVQATALKGSSHYLYYFKPNLASQFYVGGGASVGGVFIKHGRDKFIVSPDLVVGKQYKNEAGDKRFFQAQTSWPTFTQTGKVTYFPIVVLSYGFMF